MRKASKFVTYSEFCHTLTRRRTKEVPSNEMSQQLQLAAGLCLYAESDVGGLYHLVSQDISLCIAKLYRLRVHTQSYELTQELVQVFHSDFG